MGCLKLSAYDEQSNLEKFIFSGKKSISKNAFSTFLYVKGNHLGNVLNVITDHKLPNDGINNDLLVNNFTADVISYSDYYPFGMKIKSRNGSDESYRYGFQGQEKDDELKGEGNSLNYEFRMYDPRTGRFFAVDPLIAKYPFYSSYAFSGNAVINSSELEGLEPSSKIVLEHKLTKPVSTFMELAFGFSNESLRNTLHVPLTYMMANGHAEKSGIAAMAFKNGSDAITLGEHVIWNPDTWPGEKEDVYWLRMIAHEQVHRDEINTIGNAIWYNNYLAESTVWEYEEMPSEVRAYNVGGRPHSLMDKFLDTGLGGDFVNMLNNTNLTQDQKVKKSKYYAYKGILIPQLQEQLETLDQIEVKVKKKTQNDKTEKALIEINKLRVKINTKIQEYEKEAEKFK